jgi:hypothetical protein
MSGVLSPRGYRARVQLEGATPFEQVVPEKREAKRLLHREMFKAGIGARGELLAGPNLNAALYAARVGRTNAGKPKLIVESQPGMKVQKKTTAKKAKR